MKVFKEKFITRVMVRANPTKLFLFGDNMAKRGMGGQAKEMRHEPNTFGIATKWFPSLQSTAYFLDTDFNRISVYYDEIFKQIKNTPYEVIVIPEDGIGTGLARLDKTAPRIFEYLQKKLEELEYD